MWAKFKARQKIENFMRVGSGRRRFHCYSRVLFMSTESYEFESATPAGEAEKLVKRMSAGANLAQSGSIVSKDDKALKIATFSLQKYLQVIKRIHVEAPFSHTWYWKGARVRVRVS